MGCFVPPTHQRPLGCGSLLLSLSADVRSSDDVIACKGPFDVWNPTYELTQVKRDNEPKTNDKENVTLEGERGA